MVSERRSLLCAICLALFFIFVFNLFPRPWPASHFTTTTEHASDVSSEREMRPTAQPTAQSLALPTGGGPPAPEPPAPKCSVIKVSMLYGAHRFPQLMDAVDSHRRHSDRWGCGFANLEFELTDRRHFSKQYFILSHMLHEMAKPVDQRKEWIMWVDADSIVVNPDISPEAFLPPSQVEGVYALMTGDHNGLNDGLFFMRVHYSSIDLLTQVIDYNFAHPEEDLGWLGEQVAMQRVIDKLEAAARKANKPSGIAWVPREWFNTYQFEEGFEGKPGHHIVHFAGLAETRLTHMSNWLDDLRTNRAKWQIPLSETFYHRAIPDFWDEFTANLTSTKT